MAKMRAVQIPKAGGAFEVVERGVPEPGLGWVRIRVEACGICHSDSLVKEGLWPGVEYPRIPGHEVAGVVDAAGPGVENWKAGDRAGVGWYGGHCGVCGPCRHGDFISCVNGRVTGFSFDGGYAEYMVAPAQALARIPQKLAATDAGPLLCAGITVFNSLRSSGARAGDLVAVLGLGGLGHLAVQYAAKMGFETVGIARGKGKEALARQLGAQHYIDSTTGDPAQALTALGGAKVILATATSGKAMSAVIGGLGVNGRLVVLGAGPEKIEVLPGQLIGGRRTITGWPSGSSVDSEETMAFSVLAGVRSMNEVYPLERAAEAYQRMMSGQARFRVVLKNSD